MSIALSIIAVYRKWPLLGTLAALPIGVGVLAHSMEPHFPNADLFTGTLTKVLIFAMAILSGNSITALVLDRAPHEGLVAGSSGGVIPEGGGGELLRGGETIGYLERTVVVAAFLIGQLEIVIGLIAVKGFGRYSDLANSAVRERFIIGTLVSLIWSGACGYLITS